MYDDQIKAYYEHLILLSGRWVMIVSILTLITGLFRWRKFNKALKIYWLFLLIALVAFALEPLFVWFLGRNKEFWVPILNACNIATTNFLRYPFHLNNFVLLGWFLYLTLQPRPVAVWIKRLSIALVIAVTINFFFIQGHDMAGGFNSTVSGLYCLILPLVSMWYLYNQDNKVPLSHNPYFWINLGLIVPNLLAIFPYLAGNDFFKEDFALYAQLTMIKYGFEIIAQILTAVGFYYARNVKYLDSNQFK